MKRIIAMVILYLVLASGIVRAAGGDDNLGIWNNEEKDAKIEIFKCAEKYCGKVVSLTEPNYSTGSKEGKPGTPKLDRRSPDPGLRSRPIVGLQIMNGFVFAGDRLWKDGTVYDPKRGKTYSGMMTLVSPSQLKLRGFIGVPLMGRTAIWTR